MLEDSISQKILQYVTFSKSQYQPVVGINLLTREDVAKRSILQINNTDNLCFPCLLVVAYIKNVGNCVRGELQERWKSMRYQHSSLQQVKLAEELMKFIDIN